MIDASNITNYNLFDNELEAHIVFWVLAAGKNGTRAAEITNNMTYNWERIAGITSPFKLLRSLSMKETINLCVNYKTGCQTSKARSLYEVSRSNLDLRTCTAEDLESIYGIGMKTSRCFIIHSRKNAKYAGLDTHMLKHLASLGYVVPKSTPTGKNYLTLEKIVVILSKESGKTPAKYDLDVWNKYKINKNGGSKYGE